MLPLYHRCNYADPFRFPSRLCWANDRSLLRRTFAATKEVSPHDRNENGGLTAILEKEREQMRKFVTEGLLSRINKMPKGPGGLDGDFFLNAQEVDPEWGKNVAVSNYYLGKTMSKLGVILTGRKLGDRQFEVKVLFQEGAWKIDEVKF